jgi:hypothetical protein
MEDEMNSTTASSTPRFWQRGDHEVSLGRLYAIRAMAVLGIYSLFQTVMRLVDHEPTERGMLIAIISGLWVMAFFFLRYPLKMLPIFLFEFVWKTLWLLFFGLPQWWSGVGSPRLAEDLFSIGFVGPVVFGLLIPWGYVWRHYIKAPAERWR